MADARRHPGEGRDLVKDLTRWGIVEEGAVTASGHDEILYRFRTQAEAKNMLRWYYPDRRQRRWLKVVRVA